MYTEAYIYVLLSIPEVVTMVSPIEEAVVVPDIFRTTSCPHYASKYVTKCSLTVILYTQHTHSINELHSST